MNKIDTNTAYKAGYDCGQNGPDTKNCHFSYFSNPKLTSAWQRGKENAERKLGWNKLRLEK